MAYLDRDRAARLMAAAGLDALLLFTPEGFTYATGASPGVGTMWRRAGAVAAIVPADPGVPIGAVVSDLFAESFRASSDVTDIRIHPLWVETTDVRPQDSSQPLPDLIAAAWAGSGRSAGFARPETFDAALGFRLAGDLLAARKLGGARVGVELDSLSVLDFAQVSTSLPGCQLLDGSDVLRQLRMVKSAQEIEHLRTAVTLAEIGIGALAAAIAPGQTRDALAEVWTSAVQAEARKRDIRTLSGLWEYVSVGANPWSRGGVVEEGSLIKVDVGCLIKGYTSDTGRTFVCGTPTAVQSQLFDALSQAFDVGLSQIRPDVEMRAVHAAATTAMAKAGFPGFSRGHFGHGLGAGLGSEEWPFFSATSSVVLEPGMVVAFETPWYIDGIGGMIIENQLLITADGHEVMNSLPWGLVSV
ncbi:Xaa-Pro peptidase family protein [Rhizobium sp. NFR03]|uniref:M24 family metallopeptidase n=1 Tax=Rhizobium sp. NFR03 TaxID=1566263 RepID=UPI0008C4BEC6|nr:Xaa-Pro peptidase family protein [Rhizobium sp. NFR03]SES44110.1 Xaa-Pro aminopeptidase [Rhizobium sp. NFR03]